MYDNKKREYQKQYYKDNLEILTKKKLKYREEKRKFVADYKLSKGCATCGYNKCASALEFHHNGEKEFGISNVIDITKLDKIKEEMDKCVVLCANCHREIHNLHK